MIVSLRQIQMNTVSLTSKPSLESQTVEAAPLGRTAEGLEEVWFDESPRSSPRSSAPPVSVGEFLGDPLADSWLR